MDKQSMDFMGRVYRHGMATPVLFLQSQTYLGADSTLHVQLMRHFKPDLIETHVAYSPWEHPVRALNVAAHLKEIPHLHRRPTDFGVSMHGTSPLNRLQAVARNGQVLGSLISLVSYIRRHRIQILHGTEKPRDAFYAVLLGKLSGAKSIVHMHVSYGEWQSRAVKWALRHADGVIGVSQFTANSIIQAGIPAERVYAVLNSLDLEIGKWDASLDGMEIRREFNIPATAPVIGITARLFRWKGQAALVEALAIVRQSFPDVRLVIVGEDDPGANPGGGSFRAELEEQVRQLHLEPNVIFTGFRTDIPQLTASFDIYAMPAWEEPFGMVFVEAMAMEKPVIAWDLGGVREIVVHGQTGYLTPPKDIPALADALCGLIVDPALRHKMGVAGRQRVEKMFDMPRMCDDVVAVYQGVLRKNTMQQPITSSI